MKNISVTKFRTNIYNIVDSIIETGEAMLINRDGHFMTLSLEENVGIFTKLKRNRTIVGDPDELISFSPSDFFE